MKREEEYQNQLQHQQPRNNPDARTSTSLEDTRSLSGATPAASMAAARRAAISSLAKVSAGSAASRFSSMLMLTAYNMNTQNAKQEKARRMSMSMSV
jgi:hypothetical protein